MNRGIHMITLEQSVFSQQIIEALPNLSQMEYFFFFPSLKRIPLSIPLSSSGDITCPVSALRDLFARYTRPTTAPLFSCSCDPFEHEWIFSKLTQTLLLSGVNPRGFISNSFRRGTATSALRADMSKEHMKMGRSKNDFIDRYFFTSSTNTLLFSLSSKFYTKSGLSNFSSDSWHSRTFRIMSHIFFPQYSESLNSGFPSGENNRLAGSASNTCSYPPTSSSPSYSWIGLSNIIMSL